MIVTEKKEYSEIQKYLESGDKLFLIGCAQCATSCATGGEKEVNELSEKLNTSYQCIRTVINKKRKQLKGYIIIENEDIV